MRIGQAQDLPLQGWCRRASVGATLVVARCVENTAHGHLSRSAPLGLRRLPPHAAKAEGHLLTTRPARAYPIHRSFLAAVLLFPFPTHLRLADLLLSRGCDAFEDAAQVSQGTNRRQGLTLLLQLRSQRLELHLNCANLVLYRHLAHSESRSYGIIPIATQHNTLHLNLARHHGQLYRLSQKCAIIEWRTRRC